MNRGDDAFDILGGGAAAIVCVVALIVYAVYAFIAIAVIALLVALLKPALKRWKTHRRWKNSVFYY